MHGCVHLVISQVGMAAREAASLGLEVRPLFSLYSPHGPVYRSMLRVLPCRRPDVFLETRYQFTAHCNRCGQASAVPWGALGAVAATAEGGAVSAVRCNCAAAVNDPAVASTAEEDDKNNERGRWWQFWRRRWRRRRVTTTTSSTTRSEEQQRQQPPAQPPPPPPPQPQQLFNMSGPMWVAPLQDPEMLDQMAQLAIEWGWDEDEVSPFFTHSLTHSLCTSLLPFSFGYFPLSYNGPTTHSVNLIQLTNPPVRS